MDHMINDFMGHKALLVPAEKCVEKSTYVSEKSIWVSFSKISPKDIFSKTLSTYRKPAIFLEIGKVL